MFEAGHELNLQVDAVLGGGGLLAPRGTDDGRLRGRGWERAGRVGPRGARCIRCQLRPRPAVRAPQRCSCPSNVHAPASARCPAPPAAHLHDGGARPKRVVRQLREQVPEEEGGEGEGAAGARHQEARQPRVVGGLVPQSLRGWGQGRVGGWGGVGMGAGDGCGREAVQGSTVKAATPGPCILFPPAPQHPPAPAAAGSKSAPHRPSSAAPPPRDPAPAQGCGSAARWAASATAAPPWLPRGPRLWPRPPPNTHTHTSSFTKSGDSSSSASATTYGRPLLHQLRCLPRLAGVAPVDALEELGEGARIGGEREAEAPQQRLVVEAQRPVFRAGWVGGKKTLPGACAALLRCLQSLNTGGFSAAVRVEAGRAQPPPCLPQPPCTCWAGTRALPRWRRRSSVSGLSRRSTSPRVRLRASF